MINFDFIDAPDRESILHALRQLYLIRALDKVGNLTSLGREMCKLPLEPSYAKTLIASPFFKCKSEILTIVALLSSENIWQNVSVMNHDRRAEYEKVRKTFLNSKSDYMSLLNVYDEWQNNRKSESWCRENYLQSRALRQGRNIYSQLEDYMNKLNLDECKKYIITSKTIENDIARKNMELNSKLGKALSYGFFMNACRKVPGSGDRPSYLTINEGHMAQLDFNCSLVVHENYPNWILYTEISGTSKVNSIIKMGCEIKLNWVEEMIPLLKNVNEFILAMPKEIEFSGKREVPEINIKKPPSEEEIKKAQADKLKAAQERYMKRKKANE